MLSLRPKYLKRYYEITRLLFRYGSTDIAEESGLVTELSNAGHDPRSGDDGGDDDELSKEERFARDLERLGPVYVKLGQLLSTRGDFLPPSYRLALKRLQDDVEPIPFEEIHRIVTEEVGVRLSKGFESFDERPLASASIGQVHRATLRDGRDVVVKVQRPGIRSQVVDDLTALMELAEFLEHHSERAKHLGLLDMATAVHDTMLRELDYRQEAENARKLKANLKEFPFIVIPEMVLEYSSSRVLTQEFISGTKITDVSPTVLLERDRTGLAEGIFRVYLQQLLVDGLFHSDPHPGNLQLTHDGRIALIDFGMVTPVTPSTRKELLKFLMAISEGDGTQAATVAQRIGRPTEDFDEPTFREQTESLVAEHQDRPVEDLQAGQIVMEIQRISATNGLRLPVSVTMLGKTLMNLDEVVRVLDPEFNPNRALQDMSHEIMQEQSTKQVSIQSIYSAMLDTAELVQNLPTRVNEFTQHLANNDLKLDVQAIDEERLMAGMHKIANRITTGLVLAALIIGASLMMHLDTKGWTLLGYPAIAFVLFMLAAIMSLILAARVLVDDP